MLKIYALFQTENILVPQTNKQHKLNRSFSGGVEILREYCNRISKKKNPFCLEYPLGRLLTSYVFCVDVIRFTSLRAYMVWVEGYLTF